MLNVQVAVRIRPFSQREANQKDDLVVHKKEGSVIVTTPKIHQKRDGSDRRRTHRFLVDYCFDSENPENSSQEAVYREIGIEIIRSMFEGYNACVLAYGHSASGKTYTMMGTQKNPGLTPRICHGLFDTINFDSKVKFQISISFLEIYNEKVRDLLNVNEEGGSGNFSLRVREHPKLGPYVQGLSQHVVTEKYRLLELLNFGNNRRITAATENHDHSSRSHAVFTLRFRQTDCENCEIDKSCKVHLVDLAGSERATDSRSKERLKEGANINKSLVTLGNVISALAESYGGTLSGKEKTWHPFVPYRDSVLTWLLKDTLGGNSRTVMIATVSPASSSFNETLNTLRYAKRTKRIVNHPVINEDPKNRIIRKLREEINRLKSMLVSEAGNDLSNTENDFERQRSSSDNESNENNSSKNFKPMSLKKNVFREKFIKNRIDWRSAIGALEEKTSKMADEKETGVNGSVIDSLHDTLNFPDSLESLATPLLNVKTVSQDGHTDGTCKTVMKDSNFGMKRILQPVQVQKSNRGKDIVSLEKKSQRPCKQNGSEGNGEQRLPATKAVCKSRQDLMRAMTPQVKDSKHCTSSQSHSDLSTLSQSNSENSLNPPGSIDIPSLHNSKSDIERKYRKKDIVDAVISRLYVSQVNSNIRRASLQATTINDIKKKNESDRSNLCRKAKKKTFNTSLQKPMTARRIKKMVNGSTQTDFLKKTVRVKEQSVITEMRGNFFAQQSPSQQSGFECEPTNESKIRYSKQSKNDFVSSDSFSPKEMSNRKDWSQKLVTTNFSLEPLAQKKNKEMFSDDSLDAEKSSANEKNSNSWRCGRKKLSESEIINSPKNINIVQVDRKNGRFSDDLPESLETFDEIQENNYVLPKRDFDSRNINDFTLLTSKEKNRGSEEDLLLVPEGSDNDEKISIKTRKIQIERDDVGVQSLTTDERELYTIKECGECNESKESKLACGQLKKNLHIFINKKMNTSLLELSVHKKRARQNNRATSLANSEASRVIEHDGKQKQLPTNSAVVEPNNCVEKSSYFREGIEIGNSIIVPHSVNSKHFSNLTYDETEKSRHRISDSNEDSNLPPYEAGMKWQYSENSTVGKELEMKTGPEPRVRRGDVRNASEYSSLRFSVDSFEMASKRGRSAENLFGSEDSVTLVFLGPQTPEFSVLTEVIKRGLGEEIECDPEKKNTTVRKTRKMRRSLSVDTALTALSRIAKQRPIGSETKTTSLWNLWKREKCSVDEMPELRDNGCQCDLDSKNIKKKLRYSTSTTTFKDKQTDTSNLNIPLKKNCRRQTKEKGIQCVSTNETNYVVRNNSDEKFKNCYSRKEWKGAQPLRNDRIMSDSLTRRVRFSHVQKLSSDKKEKSNSQNRNSSLAISNFIKEAMNLLNTMRDFGGDADEPKKSKWLKGMAKARNRKEFCFGNGEKFVSPSSSDLVTSGLDEDSEISSGSRRPTRKCFKETSYFWTNKFDGSRRCQCLNSESTDRPVFSGSIKKTRFAKKRIRCGFRLYGSNNPRNLNEFSRSPVLHNSFRREIGNVNPVLKFGSHVKKCKLCSESTTESDHQWKSSSTIRGTTETSGKSISYDETNSKHNMSKKKEEKLIRRRVGGCVGECNCRHKCEKPDPYTWLKSVRSSFELNTLGPGSKHCVSFCTFCRGTGLELYCSSPSLNSECPAGRCRLPFYGHCPCSGAKLRNVSPSPRAYMLHLLTLRRRVVADPSFSIV